MSSRAFKYILLLSLAFTSVSFAQQKSTLPFKMPKDASGLPDTALVDTTKGPFEIAFHKQHAPITIRSFEYLSEKGFYNGLTFHKVRPGFAVEGGDPKGTGKGGPGYSLPPELSKLKHKRGTIGMTRLPSAVNPYRNSNGSVFYITLRDSKHLDGLYTVFAEVINGIEIVERLEQGDKINGIYFAKSE